MLFSYNHHNKSIHDNKRSLLGLFKFFFFLLQKILNHFSFHLCMLKEQQQQNNNYVLQLIELN